MRWQGNELASLVTIKRSVAEFSKQEEANRETSASEARSQPAGGMNDKMTLKNQIEHRSRK
jgi:hypothetical protein